MPKFFATASLGIEPALALELERIGATGIEPARGGAHFEGDLALMYRANLWLRTATRVLMPIREFSATGAEMLYSQVRRLHWEDYLDPERTLAVECTIAGVRRIPNRRALEERRPTRDRPMRPEMRPEMRPDQSQKQGLHHSHYVALKVKDAIVDRLREKYGHRP
ncbi:MAG: hypothetical protein HYW49_07870, partial [Deltaproteobacteria bacterium]|nr:hypothetical protein [Deltaproteobacteria bacterium]